LTVNVNPSSLSGQVTGGGSYSQGSSASFSAGQSVVQVSKDSRYVFSQWSGDYTGTSLSGSVTMDGSKTVTAVYQLQYLLSVSVQPSNAPSLQGSAWYNVGDTASLMVPSQMVGGSDGTRLAFVGWSVDGNSQVTSLLSLQMNGPHSVVAQYKQQFYLTVSTDQGVPSGQGWYDAGTYASVNVSTPPSPSYGVNIVFNGWQGNVESATSQSTRVLMDGPKSVVATWRTDFSLFYATVAAVLIAILIVAGAGLYSMRQRRQGTTTKFCSRCGKPFRGANNYCVTCGAPRTVDTKPGNSETATRNSGEATRQV
jgi:ribosomal protein L37E